MSASNAAATEEGTTELTIAAHSGDDALRGEAERCKLSRSLLAALGVSVGEQVRLGPRGTCGTFDCGLFTVAGACDRRATALVDDAGLDRLGIRDGTEGVALPFAVHPEYDTREAAADADEYVETLRERARADLVACAPHGGWIEHPTDEQAARVADALGATEWSCAGYNDVGGAYDRWHVTSTALHPRSFPKLGRIVDRGFAHAVSFHGFSGSGVAVGGGAPASLKVEVRDAIAAETGHDAYLADADGAYAGDSPENVVNRLTAAGNGVQIEQSPAVRGDWAAVADAVASVYADQV
ncbi:hypothetical protein G9464_00155 [Halostella sp. JP-L12]|uniref:poly-gamma-glutamate hydrolase family protein n=1 Tax=Halostella TaxID=1843185 RepID=UPI000EF7E37F|nr:MULTISPECIES: poly-gamma-glutamate hydrolase family protein [Halostella]NHN46008.1 hypothetical protein [Halostella sp. JP-L12]